MEYILKVLLGSITLYNIEILENQKYIFSLKSTYVSLPKLTIIFAPKNNESKAKNKNKS